MSAWTRLMAGGVQLVPQGIPIRSDDEPSRFRASLDSTVSLLLDELDAIEAEGAALHVGIPRDEFLRTGLPSKRASMSTPALVLSVESSSAGPIRLEAKRFGAWKENLRAIALGLEHGRAMDRYGVAPKGAGYRAFAAALPMGSASDVSVDRGRRLVDEHGGVRAAKRYTHPDAPGGNRDDFESVVAYENTTKEMDQHG